MRILIVINGEYGQRHVDNIQTHAAPDWTVDVWRAPRILPPIIDDPDEFLPDHLAQADLILSLGEHPGVALLLPDIARLAQARSVLAPIDNTAWLPDGLAAQVAGWLRSQAVAAVFPKPFCTLTETTFNVQGRKQAYDDEWIRAFARVFGQPALEITCDPTSRRITAVKVVRDAGCGCARYVADHLVGLEADQAEQRAGLQHHHYPCQAAMSIDHDYADTLMHVSGHVMRQEVARQVKDYRQISYVVPGVRSTGGTE